MSRFAGLCAATSTGFEASSGSAPTTVLLRCRGAEQATEVMRDHRRAGREPKLGPKVPQIAQEQAYVRVAVNRVFLLFRELRP